MSLQKIVKNNKSKFDRFIDCVPATLTISFIVLMIASAIWFPTLMAYFVTAYIVYYAYESLRIGYMSWLSFQEIRKNREIDWLDRLQKKYPSEFRGFYQAVLIPFVREPETILRPTLDNLLASNFPNEKIICVLAPEAAYPVGRELSEKLQKEYGKKFGKFFIFEHTLVPGEMKGKAANENNAGRELYKALEKDGVDPKNVMVSSLDSDMKPDKEFFALLTYKFFEEGKNRFKRIFQPLPVNLEKSWETITPARLVASFGFQYYAALMRISKRLINYSIYSASLYMIHDAGYWSPDIIPEDERFHWQSYFKYGTALKVIPIFLPVMGDVIIGDNIWDAMKQQYSQIRRWAWGATEIKYFVYHAIMHPEIPLGDKLFKMMWRFRTHFEWVLIPVILTFGNLLPIWLSEEYRASPLAYNIPVFTSRVMGVLLILFLVLVIMDAYFAPKKPKGWKPHKTLFSYASWVMFPIVSFAFAAIPALEAQLRMLLNKPIVYIETKKK